MSAHLHHGFLQHAGPRKVRRSWGRALLSVLVLLLLSGLAGWLLYCVRHAVLPERALVRVPGLAMMPLGVIDGYGAAALACLAVGLPGIAWAVAWVVRRLKTWDDLAREALNEEQGEDAELAGRGGRVRPSCRSFHPPPVLVKKLPADDLCRILEAAVKQAEGVRVRAVLATQLLSNANGRLFAQFRAIHDEQALLIGCLQGLLQVAKKSAAETGQTARVKTKCIYCPNCGVLAGIGEDRRS